MNLHPSLIAALLLVISSGCVIARTNANGNDLSKEKFDIRITRDTRKLDKDLSTAKPQYSPNLYPAGTIKEVILKILITENGSVLKADIFTSSGDVELDRRAREAVLQWIYEPASRKDIKFVKVKYDF